MFWLLVFLPFWINFIIPGYTFLAFVSDPEWYTWNKVAKNWEDFTAGLKKYN